MPIRTAAWSCEYCYDIKITKEKAEQHERACWHNPKNRTCFSCHFYDPYDEPRTLFDVSKGRRKRCKHPDPDNQGRFPRTRCPNWEGSIYKQIVNRPRRG